MKRALSLAAVFSLTAFVLLGVADIAVWAGYQGMHPRDQTAAIALTHAGMLVAVLLLALVGSALAFAVLKHRLPTRRSAALSGAVFALASFFAVVGAFGMGGLPAAAAWLVLGSALFAAMACLLVRKHAGSQETPPK